MRAPLALAAASILAGGCIGQEDRGGFGEAPPILEAASPSPAGREAKEEASHVVRVSAQEGLRFDPEALEIRAGEPTKVVFTNGDQQEHTFVISELAVVMLAGAGQTVSSTVEVDPGNTGRFAYFCSIGGHRAGGMEGAISVRPG